MLYFIGYLQRLFQKFRGLAISLEKSLESFLHFGVYFCIFNTACFERGFGSVNFRYFLESLTYFGRFYQLLILCFEMGSGVTPEIWYNASCILIYFIDNLPTFFKT